MKVHKKFYRLVSLLRLLKGKVLGWVNSSDMTHIYSFNKDFQCFMQYFQVSIFFLAHYYILVLISLIYMIAGLELRWVHWEYHYT